MRLVTIPDSFTIVLLHKKAILSSDPYSSTERYSGSSFVNNLEKNSAMQKGQQFPPTGNRGDVGGRNLGWVGRCPGREGAF